MKTSNNIATFESYRQSEAEFHKEKIMKCGGNFANIYRSKYNKWCIRASRLWSKLDDLGVIIPEEFLKVYSIPFEEFLDSKIVMKYQVRGYNCLRELLRAAVLTPELLDEEKYYDVLELSSGSCANFEVLSHYNNTVQITDHLDAKGSAYAPIHKWLNIIPIAFDGSELPYAMAEKSYDYTISYQAIDAYGRPSLWPRFVAEMARISRYKVVIILNKHEGGSASLNIFYKELEQTYSNVEIGQCPDTNHAAVTITLDSS